jgi:hypothetical protein
MLQLIAFRLYYQAQHAAKAMPRRPAGHRWVLARQGGKAWPATLPQRQLFSVVAARTPGGLPLLGLAWLLLSLVRE